MEPGVRSPTGESLGPYILRREIGVGATSRVYEAEHRGLCKRVAVKVLFARGGRGAARGTREAKAAARVRHPHVVEVLDVGTSDLGLFIVMELVEGGTLASRIPKPDGADVETALAWLLPVVAAISAAHAVGVVHRDLKPSNVLVSFDARGGLFPKVSDFGISKLLDDTSELTGDEGLLGTPAYMAPEQMRDARTAGKAADQYSLGVLLHLFASGTLPYEADSSLALMNRVVAGRRRSLRERSPSLPEGLATAIDRALAVDPRERHLSVAALGAALLPFASARTRALFEGELVPSSCQVESVEPGLAVGETETFDDGFDPAAQRAPQQMKPTPNRRRWRAATGAVVVGLAGLVGAAVAVAGSPTSSDPLGLGDFGLRATAPPSADPQAEQAYRMGLAAMRDSAWELGIVQFERAIELDPEMGAAHLRLAMAIASPEPEARRAWSRAQVLRDQLSPRDRVFLEALAPLYFQDPPDHVASRAILEAGVARFPDDAELTMHLAIASQHPPRWPEARRLAERALALAPGYPDAMQTRARAMAAAGDTVGARAELARCTKTAPLAIGCLRARTNLELSAARCDVLPPLLRSWAALDPRAFEPQRVLAGVLADEGRPWQSVEDALRARWHARPGERPRREAKDRVRLALYRDQPADAVSRLAALGATATEEGDAALGSWVAAHQIFALQRRDGDSSVEALRIASSFLALEGGEADAEDGGALRAVGVLARSDEVGRAEARRAARRLLSAPPGASARAAPEVLVDLVLARDSFEAAAVLASVRAEDVVVPASLRLHHARVLALAGHTSEAEEALSAISPCDGLSLDGLEARELRRTFGATRGELR